MSLLFVVVALSLASGASAAITGDFSCTMNNGSALVYSPTAVVCSDVISETSCKVLYPTDAADAYPAAGNDSARPLACYTTADATPAAVVKDMVTAAISTCPKTCGLCCKTSAYSCSNVAYPRLTCSTITAAQCLSSVWRTIIAVDCPAACGFCNDGGCVDAVVECANDISICNAIGMQDFVNTNCQKTCARCASSTTKSSASSSTCTSYIADSSSACASWAKNGFCTNTFYTAATRKAYCATTCKLC